jgi:hypothetical protein
VWHHGYCGGREEKSLSLAGALVLAHCPTIIVTGYEEQARAIGPADGLERDRKLFTKDRNLFIDDPVIVQRGPVPQAGGHSAIA